MSDNAAIAERCLKHADTLTADNWHTEAATLRDAAAEIERLRASLLSIANNTCCGGCLEAARIAQSALRK